jgi:hypothetical protein
VKYFAQCCKRKTDVTDKLTSQYGPCKPIEWHPPGVRVATRDNPLGKARPIDDMASQHGRNQSDNHSTSYNAESVVFLAKMISDVSLPTRCVNQSPYLRALTTAWASR